MTVLIVLGVAALAWWNGGNDNFKGVATLYGSGATSYRTALGWATLTQIAGSLLATVLAAGLIKTFSAKGLVPDAVAADPRFIASVAVAVVATLCLATLTGMPISTTHALTGSLVGAGVVAAGSALNLSTLGKSFFLPLLVSPVMAMALTMVLYAAVRGLSRVLAVQRDACLCVEATSVPVGSLSSTIAAAPQIGLVSGTSATCAPSRVLGISVQSAVDVLHVLSAGAICFARALNDTPKILALYLSAKVLGVSIGLPLLGGAMAVGGLLHARKVAETMSKKITSLTAAQGMVANLTTALLVIVASRAGLPVSTTHVSTSAMFGIGVINRSADRRTIAHIVAAWLTTLPVAALTGGMICWILIR